MYFAIQEHQLFENGRHDISFTFNTGDCVDKGAIQVLRNAVGVGVSAFLEKSVMDVYSSMLLALRGGQISWKKALRNT